MRIKLVQLWAKQTSVNRNYQTVSELWKNKRIEEKRIGKQTSFSVMVWKDRLQLLQLMRTKRCTTDGTPVFLAKDQIEQHRNLVTSSLELPRQTTQLRLKEHSQAAWIQPPTWTTRKPSETSTRKATTCISVWPRTIILPRPPLEMPSPSPERAELQESPRPEQTLSKRR